GSGPSRCRLEGYAEGATGAGREARAAGVGLGEVAADGDAGNAQGSAPRVAEGDALSAAAGAHLLCRESQGSRGEADHGASAGARQADSLSGRASVIGDGHGPGSGPSRCRLEGYAEGATGAGREARAAGVGLGEVAADGDAGNAQGSAPCVAEGDALSAAAGAHLLCRESQGSRGEADHGASAGARQADSLSGRASVIGDGHGPGSGPSRCRLEGYAEGATGAGREARAAGVGLGEVAADGDAGNAQGSAPCVAEGDAL